MKYSNKYIAATREYSTPKVHIPAPYFRREFTSNGNAKKAEITICGLGFYELWLNGKNITKGVLAPYITNSDQIVFYDNYDVTELLHNGANVIGVVLGNGFQNNPGGDVWDFDKAAFRSAPKFSLCYEEDGKTIFECDRKFKTHPSPILFDDYRLGVIYDARKEVYGWADVGYNYDGDWVEVLEVAPPKGEAKPRLADPIVITREIKPLGIFRNKKGFLVDFGENVAGICRLKLENATKGQKIYLHHCEAAFRDNMPYYINLCCGPSLKYIGKNLWQTETYICRGGSEEFTPSFVYHGFRFVQVEGIYSNQINENTLTCLEISSDIRERADFKSSSYMLNKLYAAAKSSDRANFVFFPTDCPQREKNGWMGDAAASTEQFLLNFRSETSLREWLKCISRAQNEDGALPGIVPTTGWGFKWGNGPSWDTALFTVTYEVYRLTGDKGVIEENADAMEKYLQYIATKRQPNGTVAIGLGDWLEVDRNPGKPTTRLAVTDTAQCFNMSRMAEQLYTAIGDKARAAYAKSEKEKYCNAFRKNFVNEETKVVSIGTHTAQSMAMVYGLLRPDEIAAAGKHLRDTILNNGGKLRSGLLGTRYAHEALHMVHEDDLAYDIITNGDHASPAYWINKGSNTLWESYCEVKFGDNLRFSKFDVRKISSLNHHFLGAGYMTWMLKSVLGIRQNEDLSNPAKVVVEPAFVTSLTSAEGYVEFPAGRVGVSWKRVGEAPIQLMVTADSTIDLEIKVPDGVVVSKEIRNI